MQSKRTEKTVTDLTEEQNKAIEDRLMERFQTCSPELQRIIVAVGNKTLILSMFFLDSRHGAEFDTYMKEMDQLVQDELKK